MYKNAFEQLSSYAITNDSPASLDMNKSKPLSVVITSFHDTVKLLSSSDTCAALTMTVSGVMSKCETKNVLRQDSFLKFVNECKGMYISVVAGSETCIDRNPGHPVIAKQIDGLTICRKI